MRKIIYRNLCLLISAAVVFTTVLIFWVYYVQFSRNIEYDIKTEAEVITNYLDTEDTGQNDIDILKKMCAAGTSLRITLISGSGEVLYDSTANAAEMENHLERPEIDDAIRNGFGESVRSSETMGTKVYYYALRMHSGSILRVAKAADSIFKTVISVIPFLIGIVAAVLVVLFFVVNSLTRRIMRPVNDIDLEHLSEAQVYDELKPFLKRIDDNNKEKEMAEKIRREFSANVSHELKTPLTSISGYAQMINNGMARDEDIRSFGEKIEREAERLILLINDIIRLSNLDETDGIDEPEPIDLYEAAQSVLLSINDSAKKRGIRMFLGGQSVNISGNRTLIGELIYNLVDNAVKYNKDGGKITVTTGETAEGAVLAVSDTGIGIPEEEQERIFERFYRVDKSHSQTVGGTGLGLSIVKHIVLCHNAAIKVKSKPGKGTEITVVFKPYKKGD